MIDDVVAQAEQVIAAPTILVELAVTITDPHTFTNAYLAWCAIHHRTPEPTLGEQLDDVYAYYTQATPGVTLRTIGGHRVVE